MTPKDKKQTVVRNVISLAALVISLISFIIALINSSVFNL